MMPFVMMPFCIPSRRVGVGIPGWMSGFHAHLFSPPCPLVCPVLTHMLTQQVFKSPEVCKVYIGSFNTEPMNEARNPECVGLFHKEQAQLLEDLYAIPGRSCDRKVSRRPCVSLMIDG
jgi:hypothetical protein